MYVMLIKSDFDCDQYVQLGIRNKANTSNYI